jgi:hypothetical protein
VIWATAAVMALVCAIGLFWLGLSRVHKVRQSYQLSLQLRQRERDLHHVQRAYHALEAYVAAQTVREWQQPQLAKATVPSVILKRATRS